MTTPNNEELMTQLGVTAQQAAELVEYFEGVRAGIGDNMGIEYGTNANGQYMKFPGGGLICTIVSVTSNDDAQSKWTFPHQFIVQPTVTHTARSNTLENYSVNIFNSFTSATLGVDFNVSDSSLNRHSIGVGFTAIGRYKNV